uniref:RHS repeat domain-containing protein n=1 Tax=Rosenbergiella epipactidis TaxID=1544694 RepID=UPI00240D787D
QPDPLGLSGGLNSYVYALNNPLSYIDPEGQFPLIALLQPMAYLVGGWATGEAMDYLISYLPDNECNPILSPQRWANAMTYAVGIGVTHKGISLGVKAWKGAKYSDAKIFRIAERVYPQLVDPRMGRLAGGLTKKDLQELANSPIARRYLDAKSMHINVIQEVDNKLLRITVPNDEMKIISVGPIRKNQLNNLIKRNRYIPIK